MLVSQDWAYRLNHQLNLEYIAKSTWCFIGEILCQAIMIDTCWFGVGNLPDYFKTDNPTRYLAAVGQMSSSAVTPKEGRAILMSSAQLS